MRKSIVVVLSLALLGAVAAPAAQAESSRGTPMQATILKKGSRGKLVRALQRRLRITADGVYGRQTRAAVKRFQRRRGLIADGIAGPATLAALGLRAVAGRSSVPKALQKIALCESGGDPTAVSSDGRYRGKYQFARATWRQMGGSGDPAKASEVEQDRRATRLYRAQGAAPWPACARKLGLD